MTNRPTHVRINRLCDGARFLGQREHAEVELLRQFPQLRGRLLTPRSSDWQPAVEPRSPAEDPARRRHERGDLRATL